MSSDLDGFEAADLLADLHELVDRASDFNARDEHKLREFVSRLGCIDEADALATLKAAAGIKP